MSYHQFCSLFKVRRVILGVKSCNPSNPTSYPSTVKETSFEAQVKKMTKILEIKFRPVRRTFILAKYHQTQTNTHTNTNTNTHTHTHTQTQTHTHTHAHTNTHKHTQTHTNKHTNTHTNTHTQTHTHTHAHTHAQTHTHKTVFSEFIYQQMKKLCISFFSMFFERL